MQDKSTVIILCNGIIDDAAGFLSAAEVKRSLQQNGAISSAGSPKRAAALAGFGKLS
jgi:hypothetical protein